MAKKRVHEIAKAQGVSSKELLAALKAVGVEAKAAASSVEEADALKAIAAAKVDGGTAVKDRDAVQSRPPKPAQTLEEAGAPRRAGIQPPRRRGGCLQKTPCRDRFAGRSPRSDGRAATSAAAKAPRWAPPPAAVGGAAAQSRVAGRARGDQRQLRRDGARGCRVARPCSRRSDQEADDDGGDGDPHPDPHRRLDPGDRRRVRPQDRDRHRGRRGARGARLYRCRGGPRRSTAGGDDHGPRRPRQDLAARRDPRDRGGSGRGGRHHPAHRRLPGPPRREDDHLPRHPRPRRLHRDARPGRQGHRRRRRRRRRR